ncbi:hypothetical protein HMPREF9466_01833 [Fusobacterium necrophorum subsp. funduliforme 1_1_36S]|nr:hypothetical protein HMPREF9466_01833 [Fusobacterium necrophorum subsp. funduliforme 1_1_36S]
MITVSETTTENIFRDFYRDDKFIEKSAIPKSYGFTSKTRLGIKDILTFF